MRARTLFAVLLGGVVGFSSGAHANYQSFTTIAGAALDGHPVKAQAEFTTSAGQILLKLTNLQANPVNIIQAISDISFTISGGVTGGGGLKIPSASYINIDKAGNVSAASAPTGQKGNPEGWVLSSTGSNYHLDVLAGTGHAGPETLIIGPADGSPPYAEANGSIKGNAPHNPFIDQSATFTLALTGVTAATWITNVLISFGTTPGANVGVPIPAAVWLFGSGLLGLIAIARRRQGSAMRGLPATA